MWDQTLGERIASNAASSIDWPYLPIDVDDPDLHTLESECLVMEVKRLVSETEANGRQGDL
jgi:hypothetical protein